jgi:hypothetical protein
MPKAISHPLKWEHHPRVGLRERKKRPQIKEGLRFDLEGKE